jgi:hypothetical protein
MAEVDAVELAHRDAPRAPYSVLER